MKFNTTIVTMMLLSIFLIFFIYIDDADVVGTDVTGDINTNTTWTTSGSPYLIKNNITVKSSATLTINPGVIV